MKMLKRVSLLALLSILTVSVSLDAGAFLYTAETGAIENPRQFTPEKHDTAAAAYYLGVRYYDPHAGRFISRDPLKDGLNWYTYVRNNPLAFIDPNGLEPVKSGATTVDEFVEHLNGREEKQLHEYESSVSISRKGITVHGVGFSNEGPRYISTENYGWVDMQHFMSAAAEAAKYRRHGENADTAYLTAKYAGDFLEGAQYGALFTKYRSSGYSYEDLPSNDAGADFGAYHYDPNSDLSLGQQVGNYLNEHAGPEGVKSRSADGTWGDWVTKPDSYDALPATANSKRQPPRNFTYKPFSHERVKRELRGR